MFKLYHGGSAPGGRLSQSAYLRYAAYFPLLAILGGMALSGCATFPTDAPQAMGPQGTGVPGQAITPVAAGDLFNLDGNLMW